MPPERFADEAGVAACVTAQQLRDILIHQHEGVDTRQVWVIVERDLPSLREAIAALLPPLDQLERELAGEEDVTGQGL